MKLEDRGLIFDATKQPANQKVNAFSSLTRLKSGTILAGFQSGSAKHALDSRSRICRSTDNGQTWTDLGQLTNSTLNGVPGSLSAADMVEAEPGRVLLFTTWFDRSDPQKPLFDPVTEGILHQKEIVCESRDEGTTWSPWQIIPIPNLTGLASTSTPLRWSDGTIAHPFESYKDFDDPTPGRHGAWMAISRDGGRTFPEVHQVAQHPEHKVFFWDQRCCVGKNPGDYYAMFWTHDIANKQDLDVHFCKGSISNKEHPYKTISDTHIPGQICSPWLLGDGRLLAFVVDRHRPGTMKLWVSHDDGKTWPASESLTVHNHEERAKLTQGSLKDVDFKQYWDDMGKWTYGHPATCQLDNDHVLLAHYAGDPGCLSIHWERINVAK